MAVALVNLGSCIGGRIGRGYHKLPPLVEVTTICLFWWPASAPTMYRSFVHDGSKTVDLKAIMHEDGQDNDYVWVQLLATSPDNVANIPDHPMITDGHGDPPTGVDDDMPPPDEDMPPPDDDMPPPPQHPSLLPNPTWMTQSQLTRQLLNLNC